MRAPAFINSEFSWPFGQFRVSCRKGGRVFIVWHDRTRGEEQIAPEDVERFWAQRQRYLDGIMEDVFKGVAS